MRINKITLKNFKNFENKTQEFSSLNFISGVNGTGKTTLILDAVLFCLWGYSYTNLAGLPTRDKSKSCSVTIDLTHNKDKFIIKRGYPTSVEVTKNEEKVKFSTSLEANKYIESIVGTREQFCKFHLINAYDSETDILSAGQTTIKKTLFTLTDDLFNNAKTKLQALKSERERLNKDGATVYTHYPSIKRLFVLEENIDKMRTQLKGIETDLNDFRKEYNEEVRQKGNKEGQKASYSNQKNKILSQPDSCYACGQSISKESYSSQLKEINESIEKLNNEIAKHIESMGITKDIMQSYESNRFKIQDRINTLRDKKGKLEARMKQKNLTYTTKDVIVVKKALTELDNLSSYYLKESIKTLEPVINSVLEKIGFEVTFTIDDKGHFAVVYKREGIEYSQKDLSTGQATIMQIAFKLSLLLSMNKVGIVIADEGLGSLDEDNLLHVISIFENYPFQLFMVLHNSPELPKEVRVINLIKQGGKEDEKK
jgi:DNA repair exonuclease SbcCD ATPase subunit